MDFLKDKRVDNVRSPLYCKSTSSHIFPYFFFFFFTSVLWEHKRFHSNDFFSLNIKFFFLSFVDDEDTQYKWVNMEIMMMDTTRREREKRRGRTFPFWNSFILVFIWWEKKSLRIFSYTLNICVMVKTGFVEWQ